MTGDAIETYADLAATILDRPARLGGVRLVAVDGPSGAGKTTFAGRLAVAVQVHRTVAVVNTDAFLDGWAEPLSVWQALRADVLDPLIEGRPGAYRRYDWTTRRFGDERVRVAVPDVLILEGVTSGRRAVDAELSVMVFMTGDPTVLFRRVVARDGAEIAPALRDWQAAETMYFHADRPRDRADIVVDGSTDVGHDPEKEYVRLS